MNREIKFRGKNEPLNIFVYGYYFYSEKEDKHYIIGESEDYGFQKIKVIPETIGQFIALKDKNGNKIYEGDVVEYDDDLYRVRWSNAAAKYVIDDQMLSYDLGELYTEELEVIGTVYEDLEWVGVKK